MIHYHGTPLGGTRSDAARFFQGRHALIPFPRQDDLGVVADVCQDFVFDNGAYSVWRRGAELDVHGYMSWVRDWCKHPGFRWALIPDVIEGNEDDNDRHISAWQDSGLALYGVPVWHLHESIDRLAGLCDGWPIVALGSSGQWPNPGTRSWWARISEVLNAICDEHGRPPAKLHGLRMMDVEIFQRIPLASADSTNAAVNSGSLSRFGIYLPPTSSQRAEIIASRVEWCNSPGVWDRKYQTIQEDMLIPLTKDKP